ncbi:hypothetical protein D9758_013295 [Tetrapyrgos nigripes]|uniref:Golgi apparatus membrane protein TVP38 n=1 Tax=Tetrapyrgos nigripes TaxID=182062 RepID=A0A8H5FJA0_9AGAR|nr:hypothetical protein D9758_013295 [Tetrapyrgos nigripes]
MSLSPYPSQSHRPTHHYSTSDSDIPLIAPIPVHQHAIPPSYGQANTSSVPMLDVSSSNYSIRPITPSRTPSPTPSEAEALQTKTRIHVIDGSKIDWKKTRNWMISLVMLVVVILFIVFRDKIIHGLEPAARWLRDTPGGFLVPIGIMIIMSFPPLFGHEIIAMLCGIVWPLGYAFLIVAAGTIIGEMANLYVFRYFFSKKSKEFEKNISYACLVKVIREGGFRVAVLVRYSLIPPHLTTTIFAVCGMSSLTFLASAILSLPKQLVGVYLGYSLDSSVDGDSTKTERIINGVVITVGILVGFIAIHYVNKRINEVKPGVIYERRKARQHKLSSADHDSTYPVQGQV